MVKKKMKNKKVIFIVDNSPTHSYRVTIRVWKICPPLVKWGQNFYFAGNNERNLSSTLNKQRQPKLNTLVKEKKAKHA